MALVDDGLTGEDLSKAVNANRLELMSGLAKRTREKLMALAQKVTLDPHNIARKLFPFIPAGSVLDATSLNAEQAAVDMSL